mgnify:CR=1 FL=1
MLPVGKKDFTLLMKPPGAGLKLDVKLLAYRPPCLMVDVVYMVGKAPDQKLKKA